MRDTGQRSVKQSKSPWPAMLWRLFVSLLWRRQPQGQRNTVPMPVPQYVNTVPVDRPAL